ncbi:hypothetical protein BD410DRAFT_795499 [Rickenella mellea]|uniref:Mitochondrial outer membrane protein IML2 n=1 Tax=Rickenella mellea TaxID=50990 RepID=A0A4Y7PME9_9AGAM|nr:hypothetical protein BD410DRAFT_795499 [Rickenella mellea]
MSRFKDDSQKVAALNSATEGFDHLFSNNLSGAQAQLAADDSPFHLLGLGICTFLEAALGMETDRMAEATKCLSASEAGAKKELKNVKSTFRSNPRLPPGLDWEILHADAIVLLGLTHALSESYMGFVQCMYQLNNAHSKFTKIYKTVFPDGVEKYATPSATPSISRKNSTPSLASVKTETTVISSKNNSKSSFFGSWGASATSLKPPSPLIQPEGPVEELILSGAAFGYGLFNLVFSLLPSRIRSLVGFLGFNSDRRLALQALAVSANRKDVHATFAGLVLMTYHGFVLLMSGYQADEAHIVKQYEAIVERIVARYPDGSLWILNQAKILRMTYDPEGAIRVLQSGLAQGRLSTFLQADSLLVFELAWTLLSERRYQEAADMFMKMTDMNNWSHATYHTISSGCYISLGNSAKAEELIDCVPALLEKRKLSGKDLPTEVFIKKKLDFYKRKNTRRGGKGHFVDCIKISFAEELGIFWNTHARITHAVAKAHIKELTSLSPAVTIKSPYISVPVQTGDIEDLDTPDELAIRSILLGTVHRVLGEFATSREFLEHALTLYPSVEGKWIGGVSMFELAVLDLKEADASDATDVDPAVSQTTWKHATGAASEKLGKVIEMSGGSVDLSSRLDTRVALLRDEIALKREMMGIH